MIIGSTNLDNMSFFYSSELSAVINNRQMVMETRQRLCREHLADFWREDKAQTFEGLFSLFEQVSVSFLFVLSFFNFFLFFLFVLSLISFLFFPN
jgi:phosphatidylserine/phosphatidylglycerophosphate/cardiolipin synthase-like enzyme